MRQLTGIAAAALLVCASEPGWAQSGWSYIACDFETERSQWTEGSSPVVTPAGPRSGIFRFNASRFERYRSDTGGWDDLCRPDETWHETECQITELRIYTDRLTIHERRGASGWGDEYGVTIDRRTGDAYIRESIQRSNYHDRVYGPGSCRPTDDPLLSIERRF